MITGEEGEAQSGQTPFSGPQRCRVVKQELGAGSHLSFPWWVAWPSLALTLMNGHTPLVALDQWATALVSEQSHPWGF